MGDLNCAAYSGGHLATNLLAAGDPLVDVQRETENALAFAQKTRFGFVIDITCHSARADPDSSRIDAEIWILR